MNFESIDPGKHCMGWAVWRGELQSCGLARTSAKLLGFQAQDLVSQLPEAPLIVVELPRSYPYDRRIRVNDLIDLAAIAGACASLGPLEFVHPAAWKGQVPKDISHGRIREALSSQELVILEQALSGVPKSLQHNVLDAVGIGQWRLTQ